MILIVDDSKAWAKVLQRTLKFASYNSDVAYDGGTAIYAIVYGGYTLAIIDYKLPDIDGFEVAKIIRNNGVFIPLFLISGDDSKTLQEKNADGFFVEIIQKPIIATDLIRLINKYTGQEKRLPLSNDDVPPIDEGEDNDGDLN